MSVTVQRVPCAPVNPWQITFVRLLIRMLTLFPDALTTSRRVHQALCGDDVETALGRDARPP